LPTGDCAAHPRNERLGRGVNGSKIAARYLREKATKLIINIGSKLSDALPLQECIPYSLTGQGFTDALRMELEEADKLPISVTLIKPTAIHTPFSKREKLFRRMNRNWHRRHFTRRSWWRKRFFIAPKSRRLLRRRDSHSAGNPTAAGLRK